MEDEYQDENNSEIIHHQPPYQYNNKMIESTIIIKDDKGEVIKKYTLIIEIEHSSKFNITNMRCQESLPGRIQEWKEWISITSCLCID